MRGHGAKRMNIATSRVTTKYQATIPLVVRRALGITRGDVVAFEIEGGRVSLRKVRPLDPEYLDAVAAGLTEWASDADDEAYRGL
jgi:AbrB family looped-hinge helix DNA binding protein